MALSAKDFVKTFSRHAKAGLGWVEIANAMGMETSAVRSRVTMYRKLGVIFHYSPAVGKRGAKPIDVDALNAEIEAALDG